MEPNDQLHVLPLFFASTSLYLLVLDSTKLKLGRLRRALDAKTAADREIVFLCGVIEGADLTTQAYGRWVRLGTSPLLRNMKRNASSVDNTTPN